MYKPQLKLVFCVCILATSYGCLDFVTIYKYNKYQQSLEQNTVVSYIGQSNIMNSTILSTNKKIRMHTM